MSVFGPDCVMITFIFKYLFPSLTRQSESGISATRSVSTPESQLNKFLCFISTVVLSTTPRITPIASVRQYSSVPVQVDNVYEPH